MIQTATLSPAITVSRGPALLQAGAPIAVAANDFAGSFAKASDDAVPTAGLVPHPVLSPAVVTSTVGDALPVVQIPETARQEWAATGNALPIPILDAATAADAAVTAWQPMRTPNPHSTDSEPLPTLPVDPAAIAATAVAAQSPAVRPGARPATTIGRQGPATSPRPALASGQDGEADDTAQDGDAGDASAPTSASAAAPSHTVAGQTPPAGADSLTPRANSSAAATDVHVDAEMPEAAGADTARPASQVPPRSRSARRTKPAAPTVTAAQPIVTQGKATGPKVPQADVPVVTSTATMTMPAGAAAPTLLPPFSATSVLPVGLASEIPIVGSRAVPFIPAGPAMDSVTIPADRVLSPPANRFARRGPAGLRTRSETETPVAQASTPGPASSSLATSILPIPVAGSAPTTPASRATATSAPSMPGEDPVRIAEPAVPSPNRGASLHAGAPVPISLAGVSNSPSSDGSEPVLANPTQTDATYPATILSDMPLATVDGLKPKPVQNGAAKEAAPTTYIAPDAPTGDGVPTRSPPAVTLVSASSEPLPLIAGKPEIAFASPALATTSAGTLTHEPQDPSLFPVVAPAAPAVTAPATDVVRVPGITVPAASVSAKSAAPLGTDAARRTTSRATVPVGDAPLPPRAAIAPSIPTTTLQGASVAGSQGLPIVPANPLVPLAAEGVSAATPVESSTSPLLVASTPPLTGTLRWTATEATTPVALAVAQPDSFQPQAGTVASAAQVFGAAIQAATKARDTETTVSIDAASVSAALAPAPQVVAAAAQQQAPLDMRQERWPHAMIEHIEMIRDAADATDTRIRLIPDALGAIDVSVKTDGDTVHVHFNAEQAATRTLLADAQPRLAELAEARGLKLGQGALGDGNTGSSQQRAPAPSQIPNRTTTATAVNADAAEDTRIA